ncbi:hypothetical protein CGRA01v4_09400 [Colletotrichum graminicola]|nr:hypothetical protein CGRA01v4_09400 [Colletotrichum graminicola]
MQSFPTAYEARCRPQKHILRICQEVQDIPGVVRGLSHWPKGLGNGYATRDIDFAGAITFQMATRGPHAMLSPRF